MNEIEQYQAAKALAANGKCEGACDSHVGECVVVNVRTKEGFDCGWFSYCTEAVAEDGRRGLQLGYTPPEEESNPERSGPTADVAGETGVDGSAASRCWMADQIRRPVIRWHGGKFRLAPWIVEHLPAHRIYCEPFGGAASVLLAKPRAKVEAYNDLDRDIVHLFGVLRDPAQAERLAESCRLTPYSVDEWRQSWEPAPDPVERARRYVFRHWSSFGNGAAGPTLTGFRRCSRGRNGGSHPAMEWANWPDLVPALVERLRGVVIENRPALKVIDTYDTPDTCFYLDPPYVHSTRSRTDKQYRHELTDADHAALLGRMQSIKGAAVISGYDCPLYAEALSGWHRVTRSARTDKGGAAIEVLWINRAPEQTLFAESPSNTQAQPAGDKP